MSCLQRTFDRRSPQLRQELARFESDVKAFQRAVAPRSVLVSSKRRGHSLHIVVIAADVKQPTVKTNTLESWRP